MPQQGTRIFLGDLDVTGAYLGDNQVFGNPFSSPNLPPVTDGLEIYLTTATESSYTSGSTTWRDISGNGRNFNLTNPLYYTTGSVNGLLLGTVSGIGTSRTCSRIFSSSLDFTFNTTGSAFLVMSRHPSYLAENFAAWLSMNNGTTTNNDFTNYQRHGFANSTTQPAYVYVYTNGAASLQTNDENTQSTPPIPHLIYSTWTSGTNNAQIGIDNNAPDTGTITAFTNSGLIRMSIGQNATLNNQDSTNAVFYEIALYSRKLTGQELTDVNNYFINRYNIV
jgi:hypothetical protein